jgi:hypothetical protein
LWDFCQPQKEVGIIKNLEVEEIFWDRSFIVTAVLASDITLRKINIDGMAAPTYTSYNF